MNQGSINTQATFEAMPREIGERLAALRIMPTELLGKIPETVWQTLNIDQRAEILRQYGILEKYVKATEAQFDQVIEQNGGLDASANNLPQSTEIPFEASNQYIQSQVQTVAPQVQSSISAPTQAPVVSEVVHPSVPDAQQIAFSQQVEQQKLIEQQNNQLMNATTEVEIPNAEKAPEKSVEMPVAELQPVQQEIIEPDKSTLAKSKVLEETPTEKIVPKFFGYSVTDDTARNAKELAENGDTREGRVWAAGLIQKIWDAIFN